MRTVLRYVIAFTCFLFFISPADAATTPSFPVEEHVQAVLNKIASMKVKEFQQLTGRKLNFKEKLGFMMLKRQVKKGNGDKMAELFVKKVLYKNEPATKKQGRKAEGSSKGQTAFIFGIIGLAFLVAGFFVPYVIIPSVISAILAIVIGTMAKKENPSDSKAVAGKLMGWITLGILAVLLLVAAIALSNSDWW